MTARVWDGVRASLPADCDVIAPERACTGSLDAELDALAPLCAGAIVVGVSGGATLGLELATRGVPFRAALLHEPAVGSLLPGLLAPFAQAYATGGMAAFGTALYGPAWSMGDAPADAEKVSRDLAMFRAFEPSSPAAAGAVITVGAFSPQPRYDAAEALRRLGYGYEVLPGTAHAAHLEAPDALAARIAAMIDC